MSTRGQQSANKGGRERPVRQATETSGATKVGAFRSPSSRPQGTSTDVHGQSMPFTQSEFQHALQSGRSVGNSSGEIAGTNSVTKSATINGRDYIIKENREDAPGMETWGRGAANATAREVAAHDIAKVVGMGDSVSSQVYHVVGANGEQYSVQSRSAGVPVGALNERDLQQFYDQVKSDPRQALLEYVLGGRDRTEGNVMYDPASGKITHIDFSHEFGSGSRVPSFSPSQVALTDLRARDAATVGLSKADLRSFTDRTSQIEGIARKIGLAPDDINGLRARLGVLSKVAAMPQPTLADLWHEGDVLYNTTRA